MKYCINNLTYMSKLMSISSSVCMSLGTSYIKTLVECLGLADIPQPSAARICLFQVQVWCFRLGCSVSDHCRNWSVNQCSDLGDCLRPIHVECHYWETISSKSLCGSRLTWSGLCCRIWGTGCLCSDSMAFHHERWTWGSMSDWTRSMSCHHCLLLWLDSSTCATRILRWWKACLDRSGHSLSSGLC